MVPAVRNTLVLEAEYVARRGRSSLQLGRAAIARETSRDQGELDSFFFPAAAASPRLTKLAFSFSSSR